MTLSRSQELKVPPLFDEKRFIILSPTTYGTLAVIDMDEQLYTINCLKGTTTESVKRSYVSSRLFGLSNGSVLISDSVGPEVFNPISQQFSPINALFKKQGASYPIKSNDGDVAYRVEQNRINFFKEDGLHNPFTSLSVPHRIICYCYLGDHYFVLGCENGSVYIYKRSEKEYHLLFESKHGSYTYPRVYAINNRLLMFSPFHNKISMWEVDPHQHILKKINENICPHDSELIDSPYLKGHFVTSYSPTLGAHESRILIWDAETLKPVEELICKDLVRNVFCISKSHIAVNFIHKKGIDIYESPFLLDYQKKVDSQFRKITEQDLDIPKVHVNIIAEYLNDDIAHPVTQCPLTIFPPRKTWAEEKKEVEEKNEHVETIKDSCWIA